VKRMAKPVQVKPVQVKPVQPSQTSSVQSSPVQSNQFRSNQFSPVSRVCQLRSQFNRIGEYSTESNSQGSRSDRRSIDQPGISTSSISQGSRPARSARYLDRSASSTGSTGSIDRIGAQLGHRIGDRGHWSGDRGHWAGLGARQAFSLIDQGLSASTSHRGRGRWLGGRSGLVLLK